VSSQKLTPISTASLYIIATANEGRVRYYSNLKF
jgi:hypothetical protein